MHLLIRLCLVLLALSVSLQTATAADPIKSVRVQNGQLTVEFTGEPGTYYLLQQSDDLIHWAPADMSLGAAPSVTDIENGPSHGFYRAIPYSQYAPLDSDGDGMDDIYELNNPLLNPLDPADGSHLTPDGSGLTNYQNYLRLFRINSYKILQRESREVSLFNFGSPSATFEANTREISIYNGEALPYSDLLQIETREVSVFNFGSPSAPIEVITREVSVINFTEP